MPAMIGRLRHRLTLEAAERTADGGGGASETWTSIAQVWGRIRPLGGTEVFESDALTGRLSHEIVVRYWAGVVPAMRLRHGDRIFEIVAVADIDERHRWLRCTCVERDL